ncbi:MAG TPA: Vps62-related protein [Vicinamibacteria bacterium]|nr:Vps62-related protein [Vicinamibacteria bacterium]
MTTEQEMAEKFAPIMNLHPDEEYLPMDPVEFVRNSRLWRGRGNKVLSAFDPEAKKWVQDTGRDSHFGVPVELLSTLDVLHGPDDASWSRRPHDKTPAADGEQYALEHPSERPTAPFDPDRPPPCFYYVQPWKNSTLVSYWFFYGYSQFLGGIAHQGDWEHASLVVHDDKVVSGFFAVHEGKYFVETEDLEWRDGRPQVYSSRSRHATWWKPGTHMVGLTFLQKQDRIANLSAEAVLQDETAAGPAWDLRRNLQPLAEQPWRLFGGAWGKVGDAPHATGPLGPWFKRRINPNEKVVLE